MNVEGIVWMGVRTASFAALRRLFATTMGLEVVKSEAGVMWLALPGGEEIQIFDETDRDHEFFGPGPVIGFRVSDFDQAQAELTAAGIEWIGEGDAKPGVRWRHFRGPDGNVYEILGP